MNKKVLNGVLALAMVGTAACSTTTEESDDSSASQYTGEAVGMGGEDSPVKTTLTIEDGVITGVIVEGDGETEGIGTNAIEQLPGVIVEANSLAVDAISGATVTSNAILEGAAKALESAGLDPADYGYSASEETESASTEVEYRDIDVDALVADGMSVSYASVYGTYEQEGDSIDSCIKATVYVNDEDSSVVYITLDEALLPLAAGGADGWCALSEENLATVGDAVVTAGETTVPATIEIGDVVWNATVEDDTISYVATIDGSEVDFISYVGTNDGGKWYYEAIEEPAKVLDADGNTVLEVTVGTKASINHGVDFWPSDITFPGNIELIKNYVYDNGVTYDSYPESDDIQQNEDGVWTVEDTVTGATLAGTPNYLNFIKRAYDQIIAGNGESYEG